MSETGGGIANDNHDKAHEQVKGMLEKMEWQGFSVKNMKPSSGQSNGLFRSRWHYEHSGEINEKFRLENAFVERAPVGMSIHDSPLCPSFLLFSRAWPSPLSLFLRTQDSGGSAKDKLELVYTNIKERLPADCPAVVLVDGKEFTPPYVRRGQNLVGRLRGKLLLFLPSLTEFRVWLSKKTPYPKL